MTAVASILTAILAIVVVVSGYVRFLLVRANVGAQFDIEYSGLGRRADGPVGELSFTITNLSSNLLIVTSVAARVRFSTANDHGAFNKDPLEPAMSGGLGASAEDGNAPWLSIFPGHLYGRGDEPGVRSVVFPQGAQAYRKPVLLPDSAGLVTVWGSCNYRVHVGRLTGALVRWVLRPPDDLNFTRGVERHQIRRTFVVDRGAPKS